MEYVDQDLVTRSNPELYYLTNQQHGMQHQHSHLQFFVSYFMVLAFSAMHFECSMNCRPLKTAILLEGIASGLIKLCVRRICNNMM
jgi:hypothetical protein